MAGLMKREGRVRRPAEVVEPADVFGSIDRAFDRMFDLWPAFGAARLPALLTRRWPAEEFMAVDEYREGGELVVKAELPGIDPDRDVELTVTDGMLRIEAQRREEEHEEGAGLLHTEMRYGSFARTLALPEGVTEADIKASYKDGILEIRVPWHEEAAGTKIPITRG